MNTNNRQKQKQSRGVATSKIFAILERQGINAAMQIATLGKNMGGNHIAGRY